MDDLDDLFNKIEKKPNINQPQIKQKPQNNKSIQQAQKKERQQIQQQLKHEINRLELVKLTSENMYGNIQESQQINQFANELFDSKMIQIIGDQDLYQDKIKNKNFLIGKFEKPFKLKNQSDANIQQPLKNSFNRQLKMFKSTFANLTFSSLIKLNNLWKIYIEDLLSKEKQFESKCQRLLKADFHGSFLQIVYAKCKSYEGQEGIVIREKKKQFIIMKENNKISVIEKENTIFLLPVGNQIFRLHGCHLLMKPAERIRRDIKYHPANEFCYQQI